MREKTIWSFTKGTDVDQSDKRYQEAVATTNEVHEQFMRGEISLEECHRRYVAIFDKYSSGVLADMRQKHNLPSRD